jgi:hypothetical protein
MIGYYVHHQGQGHLTRLQAIAVHLTEPVWGLSSLPAPGGWGPDWLRLARDDADGEPGDCAPIPAAGRDVTAGGTLHWVPRHHAGLARRTAQIATWAAKLRPRLMVADVSVEAATTARLCGIPTVVVALPGHRLDRAHRLAYDAADALLAPWPKGAHTAGWPDRWVGKTWFVGGISRFDARDPMVRARRPGPCRVLVLFGCGGRSTTVRDLHDAQAATPQWEWTIRDPVCAPAQDLWRDLCEADVVVTHAGQNAVAEVAAARRPAVVVSQPRPFGEQDATAAALQRLGIAIGLTSWPEPQSWPRILERALETGADGWRHWSSGHAAQDAAGHLTSLAVSLAPVGTA